MHICHYLQERICTLLEKKEERRRNWSVHVETKVTCTFNREQTPYLRKQQAHYNAGLKRVINMATYHCVAMHSEDIVVNLLNITTSTTQQTGNKHEQL